MKYSIKNAISGLPLKTTSVNEIDCIYFRFSNDNVIRYYLINRRIAIEKFLYYNFKSFSYKHYLKTL